MSVSIFNTIESLLVPYHNSFSVTSSQIMDFYGYILNFFMDDYP